MDAAKTWFNQNQALVYFLVAQATAIFLAVGSIIAYSVRLESRVLTLEMRGSPHLAIIDTRLAAIEVQLKANTVSIDRIVEVMTRELGAKQRGQKQ